MFGKYLSLQGRKVLGVIELIQALLQRHTSLFKACPRMLRSHVVNVNLDYIFKNMMGEKSKD